MMQQTTKIRLAKALGSFSRKDLPIVLGVNGFCLLLALSLTNSSNFFMAGGLTEMQQIIGQRAILALYLSFVFVLWAKTWSILVFISADPGVPGILLLPEPAPTSVRRIASTVVLIAIALGFWLILRYEIPLDNDLSWTIVPAVYAGCIIHALLLVLRHYQKRSLDSDPIDGGASDGGGASN